MEKRILNYRRYVDEILMSDKDIDWEKLKKEHLTQIAFFQHERLVHLIVTVTFALLEIISICTFVIAGALSSASTTALCLLCVAILVLLVPYIRHYYILENEVQKMYTQYDKMSEKERG